MVVLGSSLKPLFHDLMKMTGALSVRQHSFCTGRFKLNTIGEVLNAVEQTKLVRYATRPVVLLVTFDLKNFFFRLVCQLT